MYFSKFHIDNGKDANSNLKTLSNIVCTDSLSWFSFNLDYKNKPYYGQINKYKFEIIPTAYEGVFAPVIFGEIRNTKHNQIIFKIRMHYASLIILLFMVCASTITFFDQSFRLYNILFLIYFIISLVIYIKESNKCKKALNELLT